MKTILVANQKGGAGKSLTTAHLAWALGSLGHRVVVIDWDPQAAQTRIFKYPVEKMKVSPIYEILISRRPPERILKYLWRYNGFKMTGTVLLLPNSLDMYAYTPKIMEHIAVSGEEPHYDELKTCIIEPLRYTGADYVIIDGEPGCSTLGIMSVVATDYIIIPSIPDYISTQALHNTLWVFHTLLNKYKALEKVIGILPVMVPGFITKHVRQWTSGMVDVANDFDVPIYRSFITDSTEYRDSLAQGLPIWETFPKNRNAFAFKEVARETIEAMRGRENAKAD